MKIVLCSNFLNHHMLPLCNAFIEQGCDFHFISNEPINQERVQLGYAEMDSDYSFVVKAYQSLSEKELAHELVYDADIAIIGSAPKEYFCKRKEHSITFRYSERLFKDMPIYRYFNFRYFNNLHHAFLPHSKNEFLLAAGAYTSHDYQFIHIYNGKSLKWGYFPKTIVYDNPPYKNKTVMEICWVGRFLNWKHPEQAVRLVKQLIIKGYSVHLTMVGTGVLFQQIQDEIKKSNLCDHITLLGSLPYDQVRAVMEKASIFVFTSDRNEGWGAVLNEAMNSGCICISNIKIGATPFLIKNHINGYTYDGRLKSLITVTQHVLDNQGDMERIGNNAYQTILKEWNADIAVKRLIMISNDIVNNNGIRRFDDGPMSYANTKIKF